MIIDKTYFDGGELNIPGTDQAAIVDSLDDIISIYEPKYLKQALGYPLWKLFNAAITEDLPITTGRFYDLLNGGVEYTDCEGFTKEWVGFNTMFETPIAMYIWYWWQRKNNTYNTSFGEVKGKGENSLPASVDTKQVQQYNKMSNITENELWQYLYYSKNEDGTKRFPEFDFQQVVCFGKTNTGNL